MVEGRLAPKHEYGYMRVIFDLPDDKTFFKPS
jgi:hypothetical protein